MKVLITGGAGFLGRGILRRLQDQRSHATERWDVTVYSRDETLQAKCRRRYPEHRYVLGDVRDGDRLTAVMAGHDVVIHAAAMKYIPEAELNAAECVASNVVGSQNVIMAALRSQIGRVVAISSDKACSPVNVYGASKMVMERLFAETASWYGGPVFSCVRYCNVIGSTGSVIPLFQRQYAEEGRVKITNADMTRFWMSVDEAIDTIMVALSCQAGSVIIPAARAMAIVDVARAATVDDVEVEHVGERPGEKLHETLIHYEESVRVVRRMDPLVYELRPPGERVGESPFTLSSHTPNYRMSVTEMRELIDDAKEV